MASNFIYLPKPFVTYGKCQFIIIFWQEVKKKEERYEKGDRYKERERNL